MADNQASTQLALLTMYTDLLHHWASVLRSSKTVPPHASGAITSTVRHAAGLGLTLLQTSPPLAAESAALALYEQHMALLSDETLRQYVRIELPPSLLIYLLVFSQSLATVMRLCRIMARYKDGFEHAMRIRGNAATPTIDARSYERADVDRFNGNVMDIVNLFWRLQAFRADKPEQGCLVPRAAYAALEGYVAGVDRAFSLATLLSLSYSPLLCLQSIETLRGVEDARIAVDEAIETRHAGPVSLDSLRKLGTSGGIQISFKEYRLSVLEALRRKGMSGLEELLKVSMPKVREAIEARDGGAAQ